MEKSAGIAKNGILLDAIVVNLGASRSGMRDATLKYSIDGKSYKIRKSFSEKSLGDVKQGDTIQIVSDKRNPKRVILKSLSEKEPTAFPGF